MAVTVAGRLPRAQTPEEAGVSSRAVAEMLQAIEERQAEDHGFLIIRHGMVAAESFKTPYAADKPHIMYSASKPVTATAIGFAVEEGLLALDTGVAELFPEFRPKKRDEKLESLTIKHLLTMKAGKFPSLLADKTKDKWLSHFFDAKWEHAPGTGWRYINENTFVLSAVIPRVTGMSMVDYLTPRLFEPLGIKKPFWETDHRGVEAGGWGLFLSAEDLAKIGLCYLNKGLYEGRRVISQRWIEQAVLNHKGADGPDDNEGYGFCVWRGPGNRIYQLAGMFSEMCFVFEDYDAVIVTVGGEINNSKTQGIICGSFPGGFIEKQPAEAPNKDLPAALNSRAVEPLPAAPRSGLERFLDGKTIRFRPNILLNIAGFPMSVLPLAATYMTRDRAGNINKVRFRFLKDECELSWTEGDEKNAVLCGMDGRYRQTPVTLATTNYTAFCCAAWQGEKTLKVLIIPVESMGRRILEFTFDGKKVRMKPSTVPDLSIIVNSLSGGVTEYFTNKIMVKLVRKALIIVEKILEPVHKGHIR